MKQKYAKLYDMILKMCSEYEHCTFSAQETMDSTLFPQLRKEVREDKTEYVLYYNPNLDVVLALYDAGIVNGVNTANAVVLFTLFHESISQDDYEEARFYLDNFKYVMNNVGIKERTREIPVGSSNMLYYQTLFLLLHEFSHVFYHNNKECKHIASETTLMILEKLRCDYEFLLTEEEMIKAFDRSKDNLDWGYILRDCETLEGRKQVVSEILDDFVDNHGLYDFLDRLLKGEHRRYFEELNCDRYAYKNFIKGIDGKSLMPNSLLNLHKLLYIAFSAMDNMRILRAHYDDTIDGYGENMHAYLVVRHRCFLNLLYLSASVDTRGEDVFADIDKSLDTILSTEIKLMNMLEDHWVKLGAANMEEVRFPDEATKLKLLDEMQQEIDDFMEPDPVGPPETNFPQSIDDFKDEKKEMGFFGAIAYSLYADVIYRVSKLAKCFHLCVLHFILFIRRKR